MRIKQSITHNTQVKDIFVEAAKFTALQMHISLIEFIFWRSARFYPQCIIIRNLKKRKEKRLTGYWNASKLISFAFIASQT